MIEVEDEPKIGVRQVSAQEGLKALGWDLNHAARGHVMVRVGVIKSKYYAARYRVGDGHLLYRWGRLTGAEITYLDGKFSHVVFKRD